METGYLNFHDAEHFSDFELPLDQHDLLDNSENTLMAIVDTDFDYIESMDTSTGLWGTEQEINGDMAVLPDSGVASVIPKIDNMKEDFVKVLSDWQEHLGYMQASDFEEGIDMTALNIHSPEKLPTDLPDDIFQSGIVHSSPEKKPNLSIMSPEKKIFPCFPLIDLKPILSNLPILSDEILQSKSPLKNISPIQMDMKTHHLQEMDKNIQHNIKVEPEDCVDVETVPEHEPVLEAGDVKSLLEQFEATEVGMSQPIINTETKPTIKNILKVNKNERHTDRSKEILIKKSVKSQKSKFHKNIRDSLPKEVIDRIKASGRKKVISVIPTMSDPTKPKRINRGNGTTTENHRHKISKRPRVDTNIANRLDGSVQLDHDYCSNANSTVSKSKRDEKTTSHKKSTMNKHKKSTSKLDEQVRKATVHKNNTTKCKISWVNTNSKKDSGLESGDVSDASEEQTAAQSVSNNHPISMKINQRIAQINSKPVNNSNNNINNDALQMHRQNAKAPTYETKIRSGLATNILQLRDGVLTKTKSIDNSGIHKGVQMVSVLKKPPGNTTISRNNSTESIVTTKNSSNNEVQNIIVQDVPAVPTTENEKKPARRKLNLAEYRSRRDQGKNDNSRTCSPIQPMTLIYIHHASTTTEPIKDDPTNPIWSEREIVSVLKPKCEIEDDNKRRLKPETREIATQTNDSTFNLQKITYSLTPITVTTSTELSTTPLAIPSPESSTVSSIAPSTKPAEISKIEEPETEKSKVSRFHDRKQRSYRQQRRQSSSSSCSRSRSRSSRSSRSRSRSSRRRCNSRERSRSLSRRRTRTRRRRRSGGRSSSSKSTSRSRSLSRRPNSRRRRISHRRSSVSSSSSWSSRSRSRSRSTYRSHSRLSLYSRSRSSRSRSSSRFSSCSRSSSYRRPDVWCHQEKKRQLKERRVIFVGRLEESITKADLRRRFEAFGPVLDISLHFREHGDNYGFVTFAYKNDAYEAVTHGNDDPSLARYDLCFGGRRAFCKVKYADLDGMASSSMGSTRNLMKTDEDNTFDLLLKEAKAKLRNRKV